MDIIESKFVRLVGSRLERFVEKDRNLFNFRCPLCGDSQKNSYKSRGYIYLKDGRFKYHCHNCGYHNGFVWFLKEHHLDLYNQMQMERFSFNEDQKPPPKKKVQKEFFDMPLLEKLLDRVDRLPQDHEACEFLRGRKVPSESWNRVYYIDDVSRIGQLSPKYKDRLTEKEPRIVLPFFDRKGFLTGLTCRDIYDKSNLKYIAVRINETKPLVFGWERLDTSKTIHVLEGPMDSLFLPNALAVGNLNLSNGVKQLALPKDKVVFLFDNQRRHKDVVKYMRAACINGYRVVFWPEELTGKDVNDFVKEDLLTIDEILDIIKNYSKQGIEAELEMEQWKKI